MAAYNADCANDTNVIKLLLTLPTTLSKNCPIWLSTKKERKRSPIGLVRARVRGKRTAWAFEHVRHDRARGNAPIEPVAAEIGQTPAAVDCNAWRVFGVWYSGWDPVATAR